MSDLNDLTQKALPVKTYKRNPVTLEWEEAASPVVDLDGHLQVDVLSMTMIPHNHAGEEITSGLVNPLRLPANSIVSDGIVLAGAGQLSKAWMTDAGGIPGWRTVDIASPIATHAALLTGVHGLNITAGKVLTVQDNITITGPLGSAAYTASTAYELSGAIASHAALLTGVHGLAITAGKVLTVQDNVTITGPLGTGAYATIANYAPLASPTFTGQVLVPDGAAGTPAISFSSDPDTGFVWGGSGIIDFRSNAGLSMEFTPNSNLYLNSNAATIIFADILLIRDTANTIAQRNSTNAQSLRIYTSYTDGSNYERLGINTAVGTITLAAETLGSGTDNIDIAITPAGTGNLKFGTYSAKGAEAFDGFITIKDAAGNARKIMTCA